MSTQVWSCGGGTQSAAIAALIVSGRLEKPDLALIVDTGREKSSTWEYADTVLIPELARAGVELHRVPKDAFAKVDLYSHEGSLLLPVYSDRDGDGKLAAYCSGEWKRDVCMRWCRAQGCTEVVNWLGISVDEMHRLRAPRRKWFQLRYPLIELRMRREHCLRAVQAQGWPEPPRSACWMCPNQGDREWLEMKRAHPADFAQAVALEREIRAEDPHAFLHESRRPLDEVDFTAQGSLFDDRGCASGYCYV